MAGDGSFQLFDEKGKRLDGRDIDQLRPVEIKVGVLENADGSAEIHMGKNIILAAVYGPRELHPKHRALPDKALIQCFYRMSTFSVNDRKSPAPSRREKEISMIISDALSSVVLTEKYPRTTIDVY
ncbi:MAG: exosome complex exonuclease Rrp41, partial [Candidatus Heimdallarchaeaceae archaeon]